MVDGNLEKFNKMAKNAFKNIQIMQRRFDSFCTFYVELAGNGLQLVLKVSVMQAVSPFSKAFFSSRIYK